MEKQLGGNYAPEGSEKQLTEVMARIGDGLPEITQVRAKFQCRSKETCDYGGDKPSHKVSMGAVYSDKGENKDYADATPSGELWMNISDGRPALDYFKPGKKYYLTITEAPD